MGVCAQDPRHRAAHAALPGEQGGPPHCTHPGVLQAQPSRGPSWHGAVTPLRAQPLAFATPPDFARPGSSAPGLCGARRKFPFPLNANPGPGAGEAAGRLRGTARDGAGGAWHRSVSPSPSRCSGGGAAGACHKARGSRSPIPPPPGVQEELGGGSKYSGEGSGGVGSLRCSQLQLSLRASGVSPCPAGAEILFSFLLGLWEMTLGSNPRLGAPWLLFRSQPLPCALMLRHSPR